MTEARIRITASDETKGAFASAERGLTSVAKTAAAAATAAAAVGGAVGAMFLKVSEAGDKIQKLSIRLGASTEALSQYRLVAERSGVSFDSLTTALQKLTIRSAEAAQGQGAAVDAFRELGINARDFAKLKPEDQFEILADAMNNVADAARRQYLAQKLMEEGGVQMLQVMEGGSAAIRGVRQEADRMGLTFNRVQADQLAEFNDQMTNAKSAIQGAAQQLAVNLGPVMIEIARAFVAATSKVQTFIDFTRWAGEELAALRFGVAADDVVRLEEQAAKITDLLTSRGIGALGERVRFFGPNGIVEYWSEEELRAELKRIQAAIAAARAVTPPAAREPTEVLPDFSFTPGMLSVGDEKAAARATEQALKEQERLREQFAQRLEVVREYAMSEAELLTQNYLDRTLLIEEAVQSELINQEEANRVKLELEQRYQDDLKKVTEKGLTDRQKFERMNRTQQAREVSNHLVNMLADVGQHNKAMFAVYKAAAIAQAIISAHEGAAKTMGAYPYPINVALAALSYAAGVARVAAIASTNFGSTSASSAGTGSSGSVGTYPADPVLGLPTQQTAPAQTVQEVSINLGDALIFPAAAVRALIEQINEQAADGVLIGSIRVA